MDIHSTGGPTSSGPAHAQKNVTETATPAVPASSEALPGRSEAQQSVATPTAAQVAQAVKNINEAIQVHSQNLEFSVDSDNDRTIVKVVDQQTKEVLRQIPSKEILEIAKALDQVRGLLVRQKV